MTSLKNPHDLLFKTTLSEQKNARSFLQNYLPSELREIVDFDSIKIEKDSFITKELQAYYSDLLYKVQVEGREGYVYVLFEHKSYSEKWIGLQLLEYMLRCWGLKKKQKQPLPVIIPMVVYHGQERWNGGSQFSDILEFKSPILQKYVPDFQYLVYDLVRYPDDTLVGIPDLKVMLWLFKYIKSPELIKKLSQILPFLAEEEDIRFLITITTYILNATEISKDRLIELVNQHVSEEGGKATMGTLQKLIEQSKIEGEIKGKIKGKIEGKIEELLKVLNWTAPELASKYASEIKSAKTEQDLQAIEEKIRMESEKR